jgi:hypothetical protein
MRACSFSIGSSAYFTRSSYAFGSPHIANPSDEPTPMARRVIPRIVSPPCISESHETSVLRLRRWSCFSRMLQPRGSFVCPR